MYSYFVRRRGTTSWRNDVVETMTPVTDKCAAHDAHQPIKSSCVASLMLRNNTSDVSLRRCRNFCKQRCLLQFLFRHDFLVAYSSSAFVPLGHFTIVYSIHCVQKKTPAMFLSRFIYFSYQWKEERIPYILFTYSLDDTITVSHCTSQKFTS